MVRQWGFPSLLLRHNVRAFCSSKTIKSRMRQQERRVKSTRSSGAPAAGCKLRKPPRAAAFAVSRRWKTTGGNCTPSKRCNRQLLLGRSSSTPSSLFVPILPFLGELLVASTTKAQQCWRQTHLEHGWTKLITTRQHWLNYDRMHVLLHVTERVSSTMRLYTIYIIRRLTYIERIFHS